MIRVPQLSAWLRKRWPLVVLASILLALWLIPELGRNPAPVIIRQLDEANGRASTAWTKSATLWFQDADEAADVVYGFTTNGGLVAIRGESGSVLWERPLSTAERGVRGLVAADDSVYTVTATTVYGYDAAAGNRIWATRIGEGHVSIYLQREGSVVRVYYGGRIVELDPETGALESDRANDNISWIAQDVELRSIETNQGSTTTAIDRQGGRLLWERPAFILYRLESHPIRSSGRNLIVANSGLGMCALDLRTGDEEWCRREEYVSSMGIDHANNLGYAMTREFVLAMIDLHSGAVLKQVQFLPKELPAQLQPTAYAYTLSVTRGIVIVSFGDSNQTFGLKFTQ